MMNVAGLRYSMAAGYLPASPVYANPFRKALVVPVILHDERWADFGPAPVSVRVIQKDDITALHGFRS